MGANIKVILDFDKIEKISGNFWEILGNFSKKIAGHKTPHFENFQKFVNKSAIKGVGRGHKTPQILGGPPKLICDIVVTVDNPSVDS